jgi:prevent-host-death family protein
MSTVGIQDLKEQAEDLVTRVEEDGETIEIAHRGRIVAHLVPAQASNIDDQSEADRRAQTQAILDDMDRLAAEIGEEWPEGVSAVDAVREGRNRLDEDPATRRARTQAALEQLKQIGREISATWPKGVSALDAVRDVRREL